MTTTKSIREKAYQTIMTKIDNALNISKQLHGENKSNFCQERALGIAILIRFANQCGALNSKQHAELRRKLMFCLSGCFQSTVGGPLDGEVIG